MKAAIIEKLKQNSRKFAINDVLTRMHTADVNPPNNIIVCSKVKLIIPYVQIKQNTKL